MAVANVQENHRGDALVICLNERLKLPVASSGGLHRDGKQEIPAVESAFYTRVRVLEDASKRQDSRSSRLRPA